MSNQLHIREFKTRYHLSAHTQTTRNRLDKVLQQVMDQSLETAMTELQLPEQEHLCIRSIHNQIKLRLDHTDQAMAEQWSRSLSESIHEAIREQDYSKVVHYRSSLHALQDFAQGIASQRLQRAWAWRQLGFIDSEQGLTPSLASHQFVEAMLSQPQLISPLVSRLADNSVLIQLLARLQADHWIRLSEAVTRSLSAQVTQRAIQSAAPPEIVQQHATALVQQSRLARLLLNHPQAFVAAGVPLSSLTVLITASGQPGQFSLPRRELIQRLTAVGRVLVKLEPRLLPLAGDWLSVNAAATAEKPEFSQHRADEKNSLEQTLQEIKTTQNIQRTQEQTIDQTFSAHHESADRTAPDSAHEIARQVQPDDPLPAWQPPQPLFTEWGGLFFLYRVFDECESVPRILADPILMQSALSWNLYRIARLLLPQADPESCRVFAFASTAVDEPAPAEDETLSQPQSEAFHSIITSITAQLIKRLGWQQSSRELFTWLCARPARVTAEPGWLRITLSVDQVNTQIRAALLDINPGFIPWLGCTVEIIYE